MKKNTSIKYLVMDVDGTLTDGKIYIGNDGECFKAFSVKDGYAIKNTLNLKCIEPIIITARTSQIVQKRCNELGIQHVFQGEQNKIIKLEEFVGKDNLGECAYFGDDVLDLSCMIPIKKAGGIIGCPADAVKEVKAVSDYICDSKAGEGALREFVEWLVESRNEELVGQKVAEAIAYIELVKDEKLEVGKYIVNDDFFFLVQEYDTKPMEECILESHRKYIDIQWIVSGEEIMLTRDIASLMISREYDSKTDTTLWNTQSCMTQMRLSADSCIVLYPRDAHMGCIQVQERCRVRKIVGKVKFRND